jgi:hypothetical protein
VRSNSSLLTSQSGPAEKPRSANDGPDYYFMSVDCVINDEVPFD